MLQKMLFSSTKVQFSLGARLLILSNVPGDTFNPHYYLTPKWMAPLVNISLVDKTKSEAVSFNIYGETETKFKVFN